MIGWIAWDAQFRRQEHTGKFGPEFLLRIVEIAKTVRVRKRVPIQAGRMAGRVCQLMKGRSVISGGIFEGSPRRQMDTVGASVVKRIVELIVLDSSAGIGQNSFTSLDCLKWRALLRLVLRNAVNLLRVEDCANAVYNALAILLGGGLGAVLVGCGVFSFERSLTSQNSM